MQVGITTSQIKTIRDNVLHADTLYPEANCDSSDNDSVTALPEQLYFEKDSQLVVQNKDKEQFYKLTDKIIMKKIDEYVTRHFEDKSRQMLNVTCKDIIQGVRDSSDDDVWGVTRPSVAKFAAVTGKSNQLVKHVTHRNITNKHVTDTSDDDVFGVTRPSVAKFAAVTGKSTQSVKCVTHTYITNKCVIDDIDYELPGVTKKILDEFDHVTHTSWNFVEGETDTTWEMEEAVTAQADVPEKDMSTSEYTAGKAGYYLYKNGIDITMLS